MTADGNSASNVSSPALRKPVLVSANPAVQLFDGSGACTAYASMWRVDWSTMGSGEAIVLWRPDSVTVFGEDPLLAHHLAESYVRHFPELAELPWHVPNFVEGPVALDIDLAKGVTASAGEVAVSMSEVLDRRAYSSDEFMLGDTEHSLSLVLGPCGAATVSVDGEPVAGAIRRTGTPERPQSSAFVAVAEVWRR